MTKDTFRFWFKKFVENLPKTGKVLLLFDGHGSHIDFETSRIARENGVVLMSLPPHCTHILQPLDRTVFGPLKQAYESAALAQKNLTRRTINEGVFGKIFADAWKHALNSSLITDAFDHCGIFPINADRPKYSLTAPNRLFQQISAPGALAPIQGPLNASQPGASSQVSLPGASRQALLKASSQLTLPEVSSQPARFQSAFSARDQSAIHSQDHSGAQRHDPAEPKFNSNTTQLTSTPNCINELMKTIQEANALSPEFHQEKPNAEFSNITDPSLIASTGTVAVVDSKPGSPQEQDVLPFAQTSRLEPPSFLD